MNLYNEIKNKTIGQYILLSKNEIATLYNYVKTIYNKNLTDDETEWIPFLNSSTIYIDFCIDVINDLVDEFE